MSQYSHSSMLVTRSRLAWKLFRSRGFPQVSSPHVNLVPTGRQIWSPCHVLSRLASNVAVETMEVAEEKPDRSRRGEKDTSSYSPGQTLDRLLGSLNHNVQRTGRVLSGDVNNAIRLLHRERVCTPNQALLILRCCGSIMPDERPIQRTQLALQTWKLFEDKKVALDCSHYNALLKVHLDNEHKVSPTEFLSWMEGKGVEPNRVTFQHMIAKFCQEGDISGATTILEHMKAKEMPVNEYVFHSLITGHCRAKDFESARSVLKIMGDSGLDIGSEAHMAFIAGLVRGGQPWEEVEAALEKSEKEGIAFDDHDLFELMLELVKAKKVDSARLLLPKLPKKSGYFQEMRNVVPRLLFEGESELPFEIFASCRFPGSRNEGHEESNNRDHGLFFLRAMVKMEYEPEKVMGILKSMMDKDINPQCVSRVLESCVEFGKVDYGRILADLVVKELGEDCIQMEHADAFVRMTMKRLETEKEIVEFVGNVNKIGLRLRASAIADQIMPRILTADRTVRDSLKLLHDEESSGGLSWSMLTNCGMQCLLNRETAQDFITAASFALYIGYPVKPLMWNASLARAYLASNDLGALISIVFATRFMRREKDETHSRNHDVYLMKSLVHIHSMVHRYRPEASPDAVLTEVLQELKKHHMGLPSEVASLLKASVAEAEVQQLISELEEMYQEDDKVWTVEKIAEFLESRRKLLNVSLAQRRPDFVPIRGQGFIDKDDFPSDLDGLERLQKILNKRGSFSAMLASRLAEAYIAKGEVYKCKDFLDKVFKENAFTPKYQHVEDIVMHFIEEGKLPEAAQYVHELNSGGVKMFSSTIVKLCWAFAKQNDHERVLGILGALNKDNIAGDRLHDLCNNYAQEKDPAEVQKLVSLMREKDLLASNASDLASMISVHLSKGDLEASVQEFERFAKEERKLPHKFRLMEKLILLEDMERMQRVLDASIDVIGEEKSLYDLAHNFLDLGKTSQARKLLETPGLRYNQDRTKYIGQQLVSKGKLEALESLVLLTRGLFACDRDAMYGMLVEAHLDNADKISEIWLLMQEENYPPSNNMRIKIATALTKGGKPVPFEIPKAFRKRGRKGEETAATSEEKELS